MNDRQYQANINPDAKSNLEGLLAQGITPEQYQKLMYLLGQNLAESLIPKLTRSNSYCIASTAEDADFLSKGLIESLSQHVGAVKLACFWNHHSTPIEGAASTAPIIKKFMKLSMNIRKHLEGLCLHSMHIYVKEDFILLGQEWNCTQKMLIS